MIGKTEAKRIRQIDSSRIHSEYQENSPFQMSHISQMDEEIKDCDRTINNLLENINLNSERKQKIRYDDSNGKVRKTNFKTHEADKSNSDQRIFRQSSAEFMILNQGELSKDQIGEYIDSFLNEDDFDQENQYLSFLDLPTTPTRPSVETLKLTSRCEDHCRKLDISYITQNLVSEADLREYHSKALKQNIDILKQSEKLQQLEHVRGEFDKIKQNVDEMYFKVKTELWQYKVELKIIREEYANSDINLFGMSFWFDDNFFLGEADSFTIELGYKNMFKCKMFLKAKGRNYSEFEYDLNGIEIQKNLQGFERKIKKLSKKAYNENNPFTFLQGLTRIFWLHSAKTYKI